MNKLKKCFVISMCVLFLILNGADFSHSAENTMTIPEGHIVGFYPSSHIRSRRYFEDRFLESIKTLEVPSYTLAEDFPEEHIKTFNDFLLFYISVEETRMFSRIPAISVVKARLELNNPVRFKDFLAAVPLSVSFVGHDDSIRMFERTPRLMEHYAQMFRFQSRNSFFVENILKPLSHDLKTVEYRGYRFKNENLPQFFRGFTKHCYDMRENGFKRRFDLLFAYGLINEFIIIPDHGYEIIDGLLLRIPEEFYLINYYAQTFLLIHNGELREAYMEMYRYRAPLSILEKHQLLPPRPYYIYSDEDRFLWFEFLQAELRSAGHADFADAILGIEIEHYRELINWQLQLRAYLTQKLYEYGDNVNLSTLKELLAAEYGELKSDSLFQTNFERAIEILRDMNAANGNLVLPWIDREAIDYKQGIRSEVLSVYPGSITWKRAIENIGDETRKEMRNLYERSIHCIRTLTVTSERLYLERDLKTMVQLHSRLVSNRNINYTPTGVFHQDFSVLKNTYGDGRDFHELNSQTRLNLRRYDLIANDFWGHQARRGNGDMTVGDIILPWVEVWDEAP